jgi:hypothetical protein
MTATAPTIRLLREWNSYPAGYTFNPPEALWLVRKGIAELAQQQLETASMAPTQTAARPKRGRPRKAG